MTPFLNYYNAAMVYRQLLTIQMFIYKVQSSNAPCGSVVMFLSNSDLDGKVLLGHDFDQAGSVSNVQFCAMRCLYDPACRSINYDRVSELCQVNSGDHLSQSSSLSSAAPLNSTLQYYFINGWPEILQTPACPTCASFYCVYLEIDDGGAITPTDGCTHNLPAVIEVASKGTLLLFRPVGCMHSHPFDVLEKLLVDLKPSIVWSNLSLTIEECAKRAHMESNWYFGIKSYGECWVDNVFEESSHTKVKARSCETNTNDGVGRENHTCVYKIM